MKIVTGIGSREVPYKYVDWIYDIACYLASNNFKLRSGGALGSDTIFQEAFESMGAPMEIYLPWDNFENNKVNNIDTFLVNNQKCKPYTDKYHPNPSRLSSGAYKLMNRNVHQILGRGLNTPSDLIVCYTDMGKLVGGTSQAIRIADSLKIPIINVGSMSSYEELLECVKDFMSTIGEKYE